MKDAQPHAIQLADYCEPNFWVDKTHLVFELEESHTRVTSKLSLRHNPQRPYQIELNGAELELLAVTIDDQSLTSDQYRLEGETLTIDNTAEQLTLTIVTRIYPDKNTALEGLYRSGGMYCTQCEAEGFRRITYYPDRPDVMSVFTTEIIADAEQYPVLLSNGNPVKETLDNGKRHAVWHDPHKKPAYLFALVAGDLRLNTEQFTTCSGRQVELRIYVEPQNISKTDYALDALKRSMTWDEEVYGREYDLDLFMIVAVDDFNMGAMENKGLNIFNSSCVLASPESATDATYQRIEAIVAHEYFHNWSGNRVTCRDWFQLSLKEGFTVFRDASFSADMHSATVKRIEDAKIMRTVQFAEDAGPMAHPVQPDSFIEISNFYTVTIYEKGAEVVGMLHRILGADGFRKGSDLYFERHDGQAVTIHEFVDAMADANHYDLDQFKRWYKQAGTPVVDIESDYQADQGTLKVTIKQHTPDTPGQTDKQPVVIPLQLGVLGDSGEELSFDIAGDCHWDAEKSLLLVNQASHQVEIRGLTAEQPVLSVFRDFSAPVRVNYQQTNEALLHQLASDSDGFNRWDAGQRLMLQWVARAERSDHFQLSEVEQGALADLLLDTELDPAMVAYCLTVPSDSYVAEQRSEAIDPVSIYHARQKVLDAMANQLAEHWHSRYQQLLTDREYQPDPAQMRSRALKNLCLQYLTRINHAGEQIASQQFTGATNMTDKMASLVAVLSGNGNNPAKQAVLQSFYDEWQQDSLVINQWLAVQSGSSKIASLEHIESLMQHPAFDWRNPNKVRSVIGAFSNQAMLPFHNHDGSGYRLLADAVIRLNASNPQIAARLLGPLTKWRRMIPLLAEQMKSQLERILASGQLSKDVFEVVSKSVAE